ncbi:hypothetical protein Csa_003857 [Cucumis sativus]|nr:hypothetical protein Csa_003857 [Cucumis sativus]
MADDKKLHIVMLPWFAFGHMIPFLELSKLIAQKGHRVSFVSTPKNIDRLPAQLPPHLSPFLSFIKIPMPQLHNFPPDAEATIDLPYDKIPFLKEAFDALKQPLSDFLRTSDADCILYDFFPYWIGQEIGPNLGIKTAFFSIFIPETLAFIGPMSPRDHRKKVEDFTVPPDWIPFPSTVALRHYEMKKIFDEAVAACPEFGQEWIQLVGDLHGKTVFPIGQLPTSEYDCGDDNQAWQSIKEWLDKQPVASVVYVAFGSEAKPSQDELTEIAFGLEKSELPFFWVLRTRAGLSDSNVTELPEGFEERTKGRGIVWNTWAPQLKILGHESVGGFLTHAGWSSSVEAIQSEKAMIFLPFLVDQGIIARILEEKKVGYCIPRNLLDGSFTRDSVEESLKLVMVEDEGKIYREKIKELKAIFVNKERDERLIDQFLSYLKSHRKVDKAL